MKLLKNPFLFPLLITVLLGACDSEGIDRYNGEINRGSTNAIDSALGSDVITSPRRFVQLEKLQFEANLPSIISVMFQATDRYGSAVTGLQTSDFTVLEDNLPVSVAETSLSIVPHEELPFSLRTVIMIDNSSSISPEDLAKIKTAVLGIFIDQSGASKLLPQQEFAIYSFDDNVTLLQDYSSNPESLISTVQAIEPAIVITPTNFYGAVITAASRVENNVDTSQITQGNAIIITDGSDTAARNTYAAALASVRGKSVYTLGIGDEISADVLQNIGTSGSFAMRDFGQLSSVLTSINQEVIDTANSFYYLHYASPKRGAENAGNSVHSLNVSVNNNANTGATSVMTDRFDASDFSNVEAEVIVAGPGRLELDQSGVFSATTRWAPQALSNYIWTLPNENTACQIDQLSQTSIRVTGVAVGTCTLTVEDQSAGGVQGWHFIDVVSN